MVYRSSLFLPKGLEIKVPKTTPAKVTSYQVALSNVKITKKDLKLASVHRVRRGDSLFTIARMYRTKMDDIIAFNRITNPRRIYPGMRLKIPGDKDVKKMAQLMAAKKTKFTKKIAKVEVKKPQEEVLEDEFLATPYPVRSYASMDVTNGEELEEEIYNLFEIDEEIVSNMVATAEERIIQPERVSVSLDAYDFGIDEVAKDIYKIRVEPEETLSHYADWGIIYIKNMRRLNGKSRRWSPRLGQTILLHLPGEKAIQFQQKRAEYHMSIQEDFYNNYKVTGKKVYTVRRGDTFDRILRRHELPMWLVRDQQDASFDLAKNLYVGQKIYLPEVEQIGEDYSLIPTE
jgi:membrane-bound lytic murein transglycosylase D